MVAELRGVDLSDFMADERYHPFFPEGDWPLPAMLFNAGFEDRNHDRPYEFSGLCRGNADLAIFQYTLDGEGELEFGGERYRVLPGSAMLLTVPEDHCYRLPKHSEHWKYYYISIQGGEAMRLFREFRRRNGFLAEFGGESEVVRCMERILLELRSRRVGDPPAASLLAYDFLMTLLRSAPRSDGGGGEKLLPLVNRYCLARLDRSVTVAELARHVNLSYWHFSHRFKEETGESPYDYIVRLKFGFAVRLLQEGADSVKQIAFACGFSDPSNFCKVFRRLYGKTPEEFRRGE